MKYLIVLLVVFSVQSYELDSKAFRFAMCEAFYQGFVDTHKGCNPKEVDDPAWCTYEFYNDCYNGCMTDDHYYYNNVNNIMNSELNTQMKKSIRI